MRGRYSDWAVECVEWIERKLFESKVKKETLSGDHPAQVCTPSACCCHGNIPYHIWIQHSSWWYVNGYVHARLQLYMCVTVSECVLCASFFVSVVILIVSLTTFSRVRRGLTDNASGHFTETQIRARSFLCWHSTNPWPSLSPSPYFFHTPYFFLSVCSFVLLLWLYLIITHSLWLCPSESSCFCFVRV